MSFVAVGAEAEEQLSHMREEFEPEMDNDIDDVIAASGCHDGDAGV